MTVLYTDGLVEQRSRTLDEGMELLRSEIAAHAADAVSAILKGLTRVVSDLEHPDDVCMLGARLAVAQAVGAGA
jgi:serine phosphatase RsbU (regulator of sigma subunit)